MRIYLIRHASQQSILCNDNTSLSEKGKNQARAVGERISSYGIDMLYSSDLLRAVETAQIINEVFEEKGMKKCPHIIKPGLQEADFGILTGHTDDDIAVKFHDFMESRYHTKEDWGYPEGETGQMVWERFEPVWKEILASGCENVAIVSHGGAIRCALSHLFGRGFYERLIFGKRFYHGSITEILYDKERDFFSLERFNDGAHLETLNRTTSRIKIGKVPTSTASPTEDDKNNSENIQLILASGSPRRKELLEQLGLSFVIYKSDAKETYTSTTPEEIVKELSDLKATDVARKLKDGELLQKGLHYLILGADTIVVSPDGKILGKPTDKEDAFQMLSSLAGKTHSVYTGVTLRLESTSESAWRKSPFSSAAQDSFTKKTAFAPAYGQAPQKISFAVKTDVTIAPVTPDELELYIDSGEPFDKAGGYGIQGAFAPYVTSINGDYYNVVGLPLAELYTHLKKLDIIN